MTASNRIEPQTGFPHLDTRLTVHEHIGFELGWDYAHYRVTPPAPYAQEPSPLRSGLLAGQAAFGARTLAATRHVRKWLQLRLHAWLRGRSVELVQVTPNYLQQIDVSHCPITRMPLSSATLSVSDASIDRVRNDAGYAAGNLVVMSARANHAKAACGMRDALRVARQIDAGPARAPHELSADAWTRIAVLCSFVEPMPHDEACAVPLRVLPPNRLRLFNPVQALQACISGQLLKPGWARRVSGFEELLPGKPLQRDFKAFFMALLPRALEGGRLGASPPTRWAIEDAWRSALVQQRWTRFARQFTAAGCGGAAGARGGAWAGHGHRDDARRCQRHRGLEPRDARLRGARHARRAARRAGHAAAVGLVGVVTRRLLYSRPHPPSRRGAERDPPASRPPTLCTGCRVRVSTPQA